jgi:hypothetical protein
MILIPRTPNVNITRDPIIVEVTALPSLAQSGPTRLSQHHNTFSHYATHLHEIIICLTRGFHFSFLLMP